MQYVYVTGARRNPEQNPKADRDKEIKVFYNLDCGYRKPHYFASFVSEPKLGINPQSTYSTPIGIYTYPVRYIMAYLQSHPFGKTILPFAGNKPYIQIGEITSDKILFLDKYSESQYKKDYAKLKDYFSSSATLDADLARQIESHLYKKYSINVRLSTTVTFSSIVNIAIALVQASFKKNGLRKIRGSHLIWCITQILSYFSGVEKSNIKWNALLRKILGYQVIEDNGLGIIHFHEKTQTVFLTKQAIKLVKTIDNKVHRDQVFYPAEQDNNEASKILAINPSLKSLVSNKTIKLEIVDDNTVQISDSTGTLKSKTLTSVNISNIAITKCVLRNCTINNNKTISYSTLENCTIQNARIGDCQIVNSTVHNAVVLKAKLTNCTINGGAFTTVGSKDNYSIAENCTIKSGLFRRVRFKNCKFPYGKQDERYSFEDCEIL